MEEYVVRPNDESSHLLAEGEDSVEDGEVLEERD